MPATRNYSRSLKRWFLAGLGLFVLAVVAEVVGHAMFAPMPAWEETLLFDLEVVGLLVAFFAPFVFGIILPLTE
jgi:uncharacterized membrane protein YGL010W